jgi:hypothetical protein
LGFRWQAGCRLAFDRRDRCQARRDRFWSDVNHIADKTNSATELFRDLLQRSLQGFATRRDTYRPIWINSTVEPDCDALTP